MLGVPVAVIWGCKGRSRKRADRRECDRQDTRMERHGWASSLVGPRVSRPEGRIMAIQFGQDFDGCCAQKLKATKTPIVSETIWRVGQSVARRILSVRSSLSIRS
jgi:hypothetical protein